MWHFLHRKLWRVGFGVKKSVFLHWKLFLGRVWCVNVAFSAPEVVAQFSVRDLVPHSRH